MRKVTIDKQENPAIETKIEHFYRFKGHNMVRISGPFKSKGFNISQRKLSAILENKEVLQQFVDGEFDFDLDTIEDETKEVIKL